MSLLRAGSYCIVIISHIQKNTSPAGAVLTAASGCMTCLLVLVDSTSVVTSHVYMCAAASQALLQRQRLAAEAVEQEQKEEEFHLQQAQVGQWQAAHGPHAQLCSAVLQQAASVPHAQLCVAVF